MKRLAAAIACCLLIGVAPAFADEATEAAIAGDPVTEGRLLHLSQELRCLVCQNQNIADSNADLAQDLRREIRGMIKAGKTDQEIIDFMVARYGDFVLYRPPLQANTVLLWGGPLLLFVIGIFLLIRYQRRRAARIAAEERPLSADEAQKAEALLKESDPA